MAELYADFMNREAEHRTHIIGRGILPVKGKLVIYGDPKTNKSFIAMNIALNLARGEHIFNALHDNKVPLMPVSKRYRVLYIEQEIGEIALRDRFRQMADNTEGVELFIKTRDMTMRLDTDKGRQILHSELDQVKPDALILDPLTKFHLSDENSAQQMSAVLRVADHWIEDFGLSLIYVHHTSKPSEERTGAHRIRGSSALFGDADALIGVERLSAGHQKEPTLKLEFELRQAAPLDPIYVKRLVSGLIEYRGDNFHWGRPPKSQEQYADI